jgi:hypothetical protein
VVEFVMAFARDMDEMARSLVGCGGLLDRRRRPERPKPRPLMPLPRTGSDFDTICADLAAVTHGFCVVFRFAANDAETRMKAESAGAERG